MERLSGHDGAWPRGGLSPLVRFPDAFVANVLGYGSERGKSWLQNLPGLVASAARRWQLEELVPLANLSFAYLLAGRLLAGRSNRGRVVAKFVCDRSALASELTWLRAQQGRGAVRLLAVAEDLGAYLMEKVVPARPATALDETSATETIAHQISRLGGLPAPRSELPSISTWFADLQVLAAERLATVDQAAIRRAESIASALMVPRRDERLLHGDLHHDNVLAGADGWLVIDPKGVTGDPVHECAAMLRNRLDDISPLDLPRTLRTRVRTLAEVTAFDSVRIAAWGYAQTVLSCAWAAQAGQDRDIERGLAVAEALLPLID